MAQLKRANGDVQNVWTGEWAPPKNSGFWFHIDGIGAALWAIGATAGGLMWAAAFIINHRH